MNITCRNNSLYVYIYVIGYGFSSYPQAEWQGSPCITDYSSLVFCCELIQLDTLGLQDQTHNFEWTGRVVMKNSTERVHVKLIRALFKAGKWIFIPPQTMAKYLLVLNVGNEGMIHNNYQ